MALPDLSLENWLWLMFCAWLIGLAKAGVKGTGMFVVPVLAAIFGGKISSGLVLPMLLMADVFAVRHYRGHADWSYIRKVMPAAVLGLFLGIAVGYQVDDTAFKHIIAGIVLGSLVLMVVQEGYGLPDALINSRWFGYSFGLLGGFSTMIGNAAGPVMSVYLLSLKLPKNSFIGTSAWFFFIVNLIKLPLQIIVWGTITGSSLLLNLCTLPAIMLGIFTGIRIVQHIPERGFRYFVIVMTFVAALRLVF